MSLADVRFTVATAIGDQAGIANRYATPPRSLVRPCLVVSHDPDEYLVPASTFGAYLARLFVLLIAEKDQPGDATDELDGYLDELLAPSFTEQAPWRPVEVTGAASWTYAGGQYPGLQLTYEIPVKATDIEE